DGPLDISVELNGESIAVLDEFEYTSGSDVYSSDAGIVHNEISQLVLGAGNDTVQVGESDGQGGGDGDITYFDRYDLGDGNNLLTVAGNIFGTVILGDGIGVVSTTGIGGAANVSFGVGESMLAFGVGGITGDAKVSFAGGDNMVTGLELSAIGRAHV